MSCLDDVIRPKSAKKPRETNFCFKKTRKIVIFIHFHSLFSQDCCMKITSKQLQKLWSTTQPSKDQHSAPKLVSQPANYTRTLPKYLPHPTSRTYIIGFPLHILPIEAKFKLKQSIITIPRHLALLLSPFFHRNSNHRFKTQRIEQWKPLWPSMPRLSMHFI